MTRTYKRFKLGSCTPNHGAVTVGNPDDIEAGRITVELHQVVDTGQPKQSTSLKAAIPNTDAANKKLPEGKKVGNDTAWCSQSACHAACHDFKKDIA